MRADVCLRRSAAAIAAAEDAGIGEPVQAVAPAGRGVAFPNPFAALLAPAHTELSDGKIHFDPVPVYIGPAPGWKGPARGARTISAEKASRVANAQEGDASAPTQPSPKSKLKLARHSKKRMAAHKPAKGAAEKSKKDVSTD
ncbi:MAG: hypothetical protein ACREDI_11645 [Roseiarcus sp.]